MHLNTHKSEIVALSVCLWIAVGVPQPLGNYHAVTATATARPWLQMR